MTKGIMRNALNAALAVLWSAVVAAPAYFAASASAELTIDGQTAIVAIMPVAVALTQLRIEMGRRSRSGPDGQTKQAEHDEAVLFQANLALVARLVELQREEAARQADPDGDDGPRNLRAV